MISHYATRGRVVALINPS